MILKNLLFVRYVIWVVCVILLGGVLYQYKSISRSSAKIHNIDGKSVIPMNLGGPFSLINQYGKRIKSSDTEGKIRIIYFGYTYCPDLCPMALSNITEALHLLKNDKDRVATYFITIDPERDTVSKLKEYATNFHPDIEMLTGQEGDLNNVMKAFKVISQKIQDGKFSDYLLDHSTFIYILDEKGQVVDVMPHTTSGEKIMQAIAHQIFYQGK
jgi:cytochrome oxidase Cu insertion factor (SCO1/SenC/PrrC family)